MGKPVVFVIGASGTIGAATVAALSARYADKVEIRAGVRNPDKADKLKSLSHVTVVQATMGDKENLTSILKGVDALYIVTPGTENRAQLTNVTADAAKAAGVKHLLVVSLPVAKLTNTIYGKQFSAIEDHFAQLGVPYTILHLPYFYENLFAYKSSITEGIITGPADPEKPFAGVVSQDAGEAGATILVNPTAHVGKVYIIVSDRFSHGDIVRSFSKALGREIKYNRISYEALREDFVVKRGFPVWRVDAFIEGLKLIDDGAPELDPPNLSDYETITGQKPTKLDEWISQNAAGFQ